MPGVTTDALKEGWRTRKKYVDKKLTFERYLADVAKRIVKHDYIWDAMP